MKRGHHRSFHTNKHHTRQHAAVASREQHTRHTPHAARCGSSEDVARHAPAAPPPRSNRRSRGGGATDLEVDVVAVRQQLAVLFHRALRARRPIREQHRSARARARERPRERARAGEAGRRERTTRGAARDPAGEAARASGDAPRWRAMRSAVARGASCCVRRRRAPFPRARRRFSDAAAATLSLTRARSSLSFSFVRSLVRRSSFVARSNLARALPSRPRFRRHCRPPTHRDSS